MGTPHCSLTLAALIFIVNLSSLLPQLYQPTSSDLVSVVRQFLSSKVSDSISAIFNKRGRDTRVKQPSPTYFMLYLIFDLSIALMLLCWASRKQELVVKLA